MNLNGTRVAIKLDAPQQAGKIIVEGGKATTGVVVSLGSELRQKLALAAAGQKHDGAPIIVQEGVRVVFNAAMNNDRNMYKLGGDQDLLVIDYEDVVSTL